MVTSGSPFSPPKLDQQQISQEFQVDAAALQCLEWQQQDLHDRHLKPSLGEFRGELQHLDLRLDGEEHQNQGETRLGGG